MSVWSLDVDGHGFGEADSGHPEMLSPEAGGIRYDRTAMPLARQLLRYALAAACVALIAGTLTAYRDWRQSRDEIVELLRDASFETRGETVIEQIRNERTTHHAQVVAARALVHDVIDARPAGAAAPAGVAPKEGKVLVIDSAEWWAAVDRLPAAADLARRALGAQPNSWQAATLLGAATYLEQSIRRDRRLYTEPWAWETPLRQALDRAPGQAEPRRFLAAAYLEVWPALSAAKKELTRELLAEAFVHDEAAFATLVPVWLQVAGSLDAALAIIPDRTSAWAELERIFATRHEWEAFCRAHVRRTNALFLEIRHMLAEAEDRLSLGDYFDSRSLLLQVIAKSPLDQRFAPLVAQALERYPPGLHGLRSTEPLREWLRWSLELHAYGRNPLPPPIVSRLAGAAGDLAPPEAAMAALVAGEIHHAEQLELQADTLVGEVWGPYLLAKARYYLDRGRPTDAAMTLERAGRSTRRTLAFTLTKSRVARARGDLVASAEAERDLAAFRKREWSAAEWQERGRRTLLPIYPETAAAGIALRLNRVAAAGTVVEIRWDGATVALRPVYADGDLELVVPVTPELHLLELRTLAGERPSPGRIHLLEGVIGVPPAPLSSGSSGGRRSGREAVPGPRLPDLRRGSDPGS